MLFNSLQFAVFFLIVYTLYLLLDHKWQNRMLLVASYIFYGAWDWRFLSLLFISTLLDYFCGLKIHESASPRKRKLFLLFSVCGNLTILGFFKYFDFFVENLQNLFAHFGLTLSLPLLHIILPLGISFYTFQTMSYSIDVYRKEIEPTKNLFDFALFVTFFPQLVAGPIERASHLLPQILKPRKVTLEKLRDGSYLILWGLFMKMYVADNLAKIIDPVFSGPPYNGLMVILAAYAFTFQVYCDFAGYSEIARGLGKCMGFDIMLNFNLPFFSTNPQDFWRKWHISLSTWVRDYIYIPLGGNRRGTLMTYRNLTITMLLVGLWHGAKWTMIAFGIYWAALLITHRILKPLLSSLPPLRSSFAQKISFVLRVIFFFQLVAIGMLIFRAQSVKQAFEMLASIASISPLSLVFEVKETLIMIISYIWFFIIFQLLQFCKKNLMIVTTWPPVIIAIFYGIVFYWIVFYSFEGQKFIYFEF